MARRIQIVRTLDSLKRPYQACADGKLLTSAAGRTSRFATYTAAHKAAKRVIEDSDTNEELKASYKNEPPIPMRTLGQLVGSYFR